MPLFRDSELPGIVGIAKREGSYDEEMVARLQIILHTCDRVTQVIREAQQRRLVAEALRESEPRLRTASESIPFDLSPHRRHSPRPAAELRLEPALGKSGWRAPGGHGQQGIAPGRECRTVKSAEDCA